MSDSIPIRSELAKSIFDQWRMITGLVQPGPELYACTRCFALKLENKWKLSTEELTGINCRGDHKNGIQAYLVVDATKSEGGIAFYTCTGLGKCFYYQPKFNELGFRVDGMWRDYKMINLLIALCVFKNEILNHKTVRIIVDKNYIGDREKTQRHPLAEAIAAILQWCDNFGCTINELYQETPEDEPFLTVAGRLSRNNEIQRWASEMRETKLNQSWKGVLNAHYNRVPPFKTFYYLNQNFLAAINKTFEPNQRTTDVIYGCPRFRRMIQEYEDLPIDFTTSSSSSWVKSVLIGAMIIFIYFAYNVARTN